MVKKTYKGAMLCMATKRISIISVSLDKKFKKRKKRKNNGKKTESRKNKE